MPERRRRTIRIEVNVEEGSEVAEGRLVCDCGCGGSNVLFTFDARLLAVPRFDEAVKAFVVQTSRLLGQSMGWTECGFKITEEG